MVQDVVKDFQKKNTWQLSEMTTTE